MAPFFLFQMKGRKGILIWSEILLNILNYKMGLLDATCMHVLHKSTPQREDQSRDPPDGLEIGCCVVSVRVQTYKPFFDDQIHDPEKVWWLRCVSAVSHVTTRGQCSAEEEWLARVCLRRFVFNNFNNLESLLANLSQQTWRGTMFQLNLLFVQRWPKFGRSAWILMFNRSITYKMCNKTSNDFW